MLNIVQAYLESCFGHMVSLVCQRGMNTEWVTAGQVVYLGGLPSLHGPVVCETLICAFF